MVSHKGKTLILLVSSGLFLLLAGTEGDSNFPSQSRGNARLNDDSTIIPRDHAETPTTGFACEGSQLNIRCGHGRKIRILRANYGRFKISICNDQGVTQGWNLQCMSTRSLNVVNQMCDRKSSCIIPVMSPYTNEFHQHDRCPGLKNRQLQVHYSCGTNWSPAAMDEYFETKEASLPTTVQFQTSVTRATTIDITTVGMATTSTTNKPKPTEVVLMATAPVALETTSEAYVVPATTTPAPEPTTEIPATDHIEVTHEPIVTTVKEKPRPPIYEERFCEARNVRNVSWPRTIAGQEVRKECPNNLLMRAAVWRCGSDPIQWIGHPDLSGCTSQETLYLVERVAKAKQEVSSEIVEEVAMDLNRLSQSRNSYGGDLTSLANIMEEVVQQVDVQVARNVSTTTQLVNNVQKAVLNASSNIFDAGVAETWQDLPQSDQAKTATRVLSAVENSAFQIAKLHQEPTAFINITVNIVLEVNVIQTDGSVEDVVFPKKDSLDKKWKENPPGEIRLPGSAIKDLGVDGLARVIFLAYNNLEELLRPQGDHPYGRDSGMVETKVHSVEPMDKYHDTYKEATGREETEVKPSGYHEQSYNRDSVDNNDITNHPNTKLMTNGNENEDPKPKETIVNSKVISASINERKEGTTQELSEPIYYTLEHQTTDNVFNPTCSFWEYSERTMSGKWSQFGCEMVDTNLTHTTCRCNHLTNFAVLMDVTGTVLPSHHQFALALITYLGCIISILCLFMAFCTFQFFKNLQCDRNTIHKNLCLSLFIAEVIFLAGIAQADKSILCSVVAGLLHYFFLVAFAWMCMEGIQLYVMLIEVFEAEKSRMKYYYLAAYGVPAIVVGIASAVDHTGYGTATHCWLRIDTGFIWAFVGPVMAVITINIVMLSIAIYMMCKHAATAAAWKMKQKSRMDNINAEDAKLTNTPPLAIPELPSDTTANNPRFSQLTTTTITSDSSHQSLDTEANTDMPVELSWLKGATVLVVLLGLTWSFGLLYINEQSVVMAYIFAILNSLQGLFIYIFHCTMNEKVQKEYKRACRRATWLPEAIRVRYGGAKPYVSTSPNQSTTSGGNKVVTSKTTQERRMSMEYFTRLLSGRKRKRSSTTSLPKSSSSGTKSWFIFHKNRQSLSNGGCRESQLTNPSSPRDSAIYSEPTEDPNGYLEPVSLRIHDSVFDDANCDLSAIEGSIVDSDFLSEYCRNGLPINVEKYKIQKTPPSYHGDKSERPESLYDSDPEMMKLREKERLLSEYDNSSRLKLDVDLSDDDGFDSLPKNGDSVQAQLNHLNNLNRDTSSNEDNREECIYTEIEKPYWAPAPGNISQGQGTLKRDNVTQCSLPHIGPEAPGVVIVPTEEVAINKVQNALSASHDGPILLYNGKPIENRLSTGTQAAMDAHNYRLHSSDC